MVLWKVVIFLKDSDFTVGFSKGFVISSLCDSVSGDFKKVVCFLV